MRARYYIYRNLNKGGFSVKYRGRVIAVCDAIKAARVEFKVSAAGRLRAIRDKKRNVHAYAVCSSWEEAQCQDMAPLHEVWYNPFKAERFRSNGEDIHGAPVAYFSNGKCYA